jgi:hypothetical protein
MAIAGHTGVGKTVLAKIWLAEAMRKAQIGETNSPCPYQYLCIPAMPTQKGLLAAFLSAITDSPSDLPSRGMTIWRMESHLFRLLPTSGIHLIIVDNCEHLIRHQSRHTIDPQIEFLVRMASQCKLSLILLGETRAMAQLVDTSPKLERRVGSLVQLASFTWDRRSPETVKEWCSLLFSLDRALPFNESGLAEENVAYRLYYATDGILGWLMQLIYFAARKAISEGITTLREPA